MTSLIKNPHPPTKKIFSSANDKIFCVFWAFDRVGSTYWTREIPAQSLMWSGVFFAKSPKAARRESVKFQQALLFQQFKLLKACIAISAACYVYHINSLASAWFQGFSEKKHLNARGFTLSYHKENDLSYGNSQKNFTSLAAWLFFFTHASFQTVWNYMA